MVRHKIAFLAVMAALAAGVLSMLGAGPAQEGVPPQPFFPDFFSGLVLLQGAPPPTGTRLVACINDCDFGFASQTVRVETGGKYSNLVVDPKDPALAGGTISFYLVNEFGRIRAAETKRFEAGYNLYSLDLTFSQPAPMPPPPPMPTPTATPTATPLPTPSLPVPGDPRVAALPPLALGLGAGALLIGIVFLLVARRRAF